MAASTSISFLSHNPFLGSSQNVLSVSICPRFVGTVPMQWPPQHQPLFAVEARAKTRREDRLARHSRIRKKEPSGSPCFYALTFQRPMKTTRSTVRRRGRKDPSLFSLNPLHHVPRCKAPFAKRRKRGDYGRTRGSQGIKSCNLGIKHVPLQLQLQLRLKLRPLSPPQHLPPVWFGAMRGTPLETPGGPTS